MRPHYRGSSASTATPTHARDLVTVRNIDIPVGRTSAGSRPIWNIISKTFRIILPN